MENFLEHRDAGLLVCLNSCALEHADPPHLCWLLRMGG
jgi:hypothetical protein